MRRVDGILLESDDVALAAVLVRAGVAYLQRANGSVPHAALRLRDQLAAFAARETAALLASAERESANPAVTLTVEDSFPQQMTVRTACGLLGLSPQAVRGHCRSGALAAIRSPAGNWQIDAHSAAAMAARRKERRDD